MCAELVLENTAKEDLLKDTHTKLDTEVEVHRLQVEEVHRSMAQTQHVEKLLKEAQEKIQKDEGLYRLQVTILEETQKKLDEKGAKEIGRTGQS